MPRGEPLPAPAAIALRTPGRRHGADVRRHPGSSPQPATPAANPPVQRRATSRGTAGGNITAIRTLADEIGNASGAVERLTHNANRIGRVVNVINAISQQTNLLALNAAIRRPGLVSRDAALRWWPTGSHPRQPHPAGDGGDQQMIRRAAGRYRALNDIMEKTVAAPPTANNSSPRWARHRAAQPNSDAVLEMSTQIATSSEEQSSVAERSPAIWIKVRHEAAGWKSPPAPRLRHHPLAGTASELGQSTHRPARPPPAGHRPDGPLGHHWDA